MPNLVAVGLMVSEKKIFKDYKKNSVLLSWQSEFLKESNYFKKFCRGPCQEHFCEISSQADKQFQRCLKKKLTHGRTDTRTDGHTDGRRTTGPDISSLAYGQWR